MKIFTFNCKGKLLTINTPVVMGILNVTPDSFYDGGKYIDDRSILLHVERMLEEGATFIDIGGLSSRPGSEMISEEEEIKRILPPLKSIHARFPEAVLSIDTFRSKIAEIAIQEGVSIINDISGGQEENRIFEIAAKYNCPLILMHRKGNFQTMHQQTNYEHLIPELTDFFIQQVSKAKKFGIKDVIIDPGFGFSKTVEQNFSLLKNLYFFTQLGCPVLAGLSRKSMLCRLLEIKPENALNATSSANTIALQNGAGILRVHDVKEAMECIKIFNQLQLI